jgi:hypothetical protein
VGFRRGARGREGGRRSRAGLGEAEARWAGARHMLVRFSVVAYLGSQVLGWFDFRSLPRKRVETRLRTGLGRNGSENQGPCGLPGSRRFGSEVRDHGSHEDSEEIIEGSGEN